MTEINHSHVVVGLRVIETVAEIEIVIAVVRAIAPAVNHVIDPKFDAQTRELARAGTSVAREVMCAARVLI